MLNGPIATSETELLYVLSQPIKQSDKLFLMFPFLSDYTGGCDVQKERYT